MTDDDLLAAFGPKSRQNTRRREWKASPKGKEGARRNRLWSLYRLTIEQYEGILEFQGGTCAGCNRLPGMQRLHVDHCHTTGQIRGLLCWSCNKGLAFYDDNPERLRIMAFYLETPPAVVALKTPVYGLLGKAQRKKKMVYGPPS